MLIGLYRSDHHLYLLDLSVFMFIVPVGAIVSSWIVYGETLASSTLIGCLMAFAAVILFNMKK